MATQIQEEGESVRISQKKSIQEELEVAQMSVKSINEGAICPNAPNDSLATSNQEEGTVMKWGIFAST